MATENDPLALLRRALDQTGELVAGTRREQAELPTPCRSWTVAQLIGHVVTDMGNFAAAVSGATPDWSKGPEAVDDWTAAFAAGREELDAAWASADLQSQIVNGGPADHGVRGPWLGHRPRHGPEREPRRRCCRARCALEQTESQPAVPRTRG